MTSKLIVTNRKRLRSKYGSSGLKKIETRVRKLIRADRQRGLTTLFVAMDIQGDVSRHGAPKITDADDDAQTKACIDALFNAIEPDYLMILGAPDVVCHQLLDNPVINDDDIDVPSDLPYASAAPFSTDIVDFVGPTRVVGRLPDIAGEDDPTALLSALDTAITWKRRGRNAYNSCCGISTESWQVSTRKSTRKVFGRADVDFISPPAAAPWSKRELAPRLHFINCHGLDFDFSFYGDDGAGQQPPAIQQSDYVGRLREGTVMVAECCFGAMLYEAPDFQLPPGICNTAMMNGVYAFLGSTNVAWGPADTTDYADLVCAQFLSNIRAGASSGRALLETRQKYATSQAPLDPVDLKTLAQFCLLGDPSIHPVHPTKRKASSTTAARRKTLTRRGKRIARAVACVESKPDSVKDGAMSKRLTDSLPGSFASTVGDILGYVIRGAAQPALAKSKAAIKAARGGGRYLIVGAVDERTQRPQSRAKAKTVQSSADPDVLMLALERGRKLEYVKTLYRR